MMTHAYYLFIKKSGGEYHTISFYGTKFAFHSKGIWVIDSESDLSSYSEYISGKNKWGVSQIDVGYNIDTAQTVENIMMKMDEGMEYYYKSHLKNKPGKNNCNTAINETVVKTKRF